MSLISDLVSCSAPVESCVPVHTRAGLVRVALDLASAVVDLGVDLDGDLFGPDPPALGTAVPSGSTAGADARG